MFLIAYITSAISGCMFRLLLCSVKRLHTPHYAASQKGMILHINHADLKYQARESAKYIINT